MQNFDKKKRSLTVEKYLPHNFLAEKIVLCSLLINSDTVEIILNNLTVKTFYFKNHQEIYKAIIRLYKKKIPIDLITLTSFLQDNGLLEKIGGLKILIDLVNQIPNILYLEEYIRLLQDKFLRRTLIITLRRPYLTTRFDYISVFYKRNNRLYNLLLQLM